MATRTAVLDRYFRIGERGSTVGREVRGGLVTFVTMAYIVVLNPLIIGSFAGDPAHTDKFGGWLPADQVAAVTALVAGVMTILFGLIANYPFAMATGLGINAFVAVSIAPQMSWAAAMGLVVVNGLVVIILVVTGVRTAVFNAVPPALKSAIAVGIGLFITLIGLVDAGFVRRLPDAANTTVPVGLGINGSIASWPTIVLEAIVDAGPSLGTNPKGWNLGYPALPDHVVDTPNLSLIGDVNFDAWVQVPILTAVLIVFTLVLTDFFDTIGTMTGLGKEAGLLDAEGRLPNTGKALFVDALGAVAGGAASSSSNTVYVESAAGIAEGARTGLANIVTGLLFIVAMFLTPLYSSVPIEAAAPALVVVGVLMMAQIKEIDFSDFTIALPAFLTIVVMPFTYSIANGIGAGFISYVVLRTATGRVRGIHPLMWIVAVAFVVYFAMGPIQAALH